MATKKSDQSKVLMWVGVVAVVYVLWKVIPAALKKLSSSSSGGGGYYGPVGGVGSALPQMQPQQSAQKGGLSTPPMLGAPGAPFSNGAGQALRAFLGGINQFNQLTMPYFNNLQSDLSTQIAQGIDNYTIQSQPLNLFPVDQLAQPIPGYYDAGSAASDPGYNGTSYIDTTSYIPGFDTSGLSSSDPGSSAVIDTTSYMTGFDTLSNSSNSYDTPDGLTYPTDQLYQFS